MNKQFKEIRIDELALKSCDGQLTMEERAELNRMLKNPQHLLAYQDIIQTVASLQNVDPIMDRVEIQIRQQHFRQKQGIGFAAAAACIVLALFAGMKLLNTSPTPTNPPAVVETIFSKSSEFDKTANRIEEKIRARYPMYIRPVHGGLIYSRVKSEIKTLKQTPLLGKENGDV
ncbi:MAG: hypothetical protein ACYSU8_09160 [Planctomycetota bacterium]|jgi:hypothetical protein